MRKTSLSLAAALIAVALLLLALVDLRRAFLFPGDTYLWKNSFFLFSPWQLVLVALAFVGFRFSASSLEALTPKENKIFLLGLFLILIADFILYRGVALDRNLTAGKIGLDWLNAFGETGILKAFYLSVSYILTVWHATVLSCFLGGLGLLALPHLASYLERKSFHQCGLMGTLFSITQPLCSCCVAVTAPSLLGQRFPHTFSISVLLGAPLLNLSTLVLAASFLPLPYAIIRILGGIFVTLILSLGLGIFLTKNESVCELPAQLSPSLSGNPVTQWLRLSGRLALWLFPSIIVGVMLTSFLWQFWPQSLTNSALSVALVSFFGTLLMISTWSEIPLTLELINHGFSGPAAAALIALPAVNLASLLLIGKSTRQWKLVLAMGVSVMLVSFLIGIIFL